MRTIRPDEVYNLGAQSHVRVSFDVPEYTADTDAMGTLRLLDAIREEGVQARFYQASSSEMFGKVREVPQTEETPFHPRSPYGVSKVFSYWITRNYREAYGMYAVNGILFNHESPRRGPTFVTRKITRAVGAILRGEQNELKLGNLDAKRDWGYAKDYMDGAWRMLQLDEPDDFVLATGETHSVQEFLDEAFGHAGLDWKRLREDRRALLPPGRGRPADRRLLEGEGGVRLGADRALPGARADDGRRRPRARQARRALSVSWPRDDAKLERVRALMAEDGLDTLVVRAPDNVLYLTNFWSMKGYDACVFPREGEPMLICLEASAEDAERNGVDDGRALRARLRRDRPAAGAGAHARGGVSRPRTAASASSSRSARRPPTAWSASRRRSRRRGSTRSPARRTRRRCSPARG